MNVHKLIAVALATLLITAGAAAATPGESPTNDGTETAEEHQPTETGDDATDADENATDSDVNETDADAEAADARDGNASEAPPTDMPEPVPDHVSEIHQLIRDKLNGDLGNTSLGEAISGVAGGDDEADEQSANADVESENASENADERSGQASNAGVAGDLPEQAADHVGAIRDAISSFLNGGENPGDDVSTAASG